MIRSRATRGCLAGVGALVLVAAVAPAAGTSASYDQPTALRGPAVVAPGQRVTFHATNVRSDSTASVSIQVADYVGSNNAGVGIPRAYETDRAGNATLRFVWPDHYFLKCYRRSCPASRHRTVRWEPDQAAAVQVCTSEPENASACRSRIVRIEYAVHETPPELSLPRELPKAGIGLPHIDLGQLASGLLNFAESMLEIAASDKPAVQGVLCGVDVSNRLAFMAYLGNLAASENSDAQRSMADLLDRTFYALSADERDVLETGLGEPWSDASNQEKVQFAAAPSLSGPLFGALQRTIQEKAPKGIPC